MKLQILTFALLSSLMVMSCNSENKNQNGDADTSMSTMGATDPMQDSISTDSTTTDTLQKDSTSTSTSGIE